MNHPIEIYEFSTGIRVGTLPDGTWVSRGFTGGYMNVTLTQIPYAVERAIANKLFAALGGTETPQPAIIAREVYGQETEMQPEEKCWSVIAIITQGRDEWKRSFPVYRYFLSEGKGNLGKILDWMDTIKQATGQLPVFNPNPQKSIGESIKFIANSPQIQEIPDIRGDRPLILPPGNKYTLQDINHFATVNADNGLVAWAADVQALETPGNFIIIRAANDEAIETLRNAITQILTKERERIRSLFVEPECVQPCPPPLLGRLMVAEQEQALTPTSFVSTPPPPSVPQKALLKILTIIGIFAGVVYLIVSLILMFLYPKKDVLFLVDLSASTEEMQKKYPTIVNNYIQKNKINFIFGKSGIIYFSSKAKYVQFPNDAIERKNLANYVYKSIPIAINEYCYRDDSWVCGKGSDLDAALVPVVDIGCEKCEIVLISDGDLDINNRVLTQKIYDNKVKFSIIALPGFKNKQPIIMLLNQSGGKIEYLSDK